MDSEARIPGITMTVRVDIFTKAVDSNPQTYQPKFPNQLCDSHSDYIEHTTNVHLIPPLTTITDTRKQKRSTEIQTKPSGVIHPGFVGFKFLRAHKFLHQSSSWLMKQITGWWWDEKVSDVSYESRLYSINSQTLPVSCKGTVWIRNNIHSWGQRGGIWQILDTVLVKIKDVVGLQCHKTVTKISQTRSSMRYDISILFFCGVNFWVSLWRPRGATIQYRHLRVPCSRSMFPQHSTPGTSCSLFLFPQESEYTLRWRYQRHEYH